MNIKPISGIQRDFIQKTAREVSGNGSLMQAPQQLATSSSRRTYLQSIDGAVKAHEKSHLLTLGGYARGGISYDYIILPSGEKYAVGGSVGVDMKPVPGDPEATIRKMRIIRAASFGPMNPSGPDQQIAQTALLIEMQAKQELASDRAGTAAPPDADSTPVPGNPLATIRKAESMRREALASGDMSPRTLQQVSQSYMMEMRAQRALDEKKDSRHGLSITA